MARDCCAPCRTGCNGCLGILTANRFLAALIAGAPVLYIFGFVIYYAVNPFPYMSFVSTPAHILFGFLIASWILAIVSLAIKLPNVLYVSIFIYTSIGHWALVSFLILLSYGFAELGGTFDSFLASGLIPQIGLLLAAAAVMGASRDRMLNEFETQASSELVDTHVTTVPESSRVLTASS